MKITIAYNLRTKMTEEHAELLSQEDVDRLYEALVELKHDVVKVEVSGKPNEIVERLLDSEPDLIFNVAEGTIGSSREAFYPGRYEQLDLPFTGGNASLLHINLDKQLAKTVVASHGVAAPKGILVTKAEPNIPKDLRFPLFIKPNSEGSSKGITQDSIVENLEQCQARIKQLLPQYPAGLVVEEFIPGKELSIPYLEAFPGKFLPIVEHTFDLKKLGAKYNIYEYEMKQASERAKAVAVKCPADISEEETKKVIQISREIFSFMNCPDVGRIDVRLHNDGTPYFIELNPLPSLHPVGSLMTAARVKGLEYKDVIKLILRSAAKRYHLGVRAPKKAADDGKKAPPRPTARELGITTGRFQTGVHNAITDVKGVRVGHYTHIEDNVEIPGSSGTTSIRTGVTAVLPVSGVFENRVVGGGFVLNGVGEMSGLTQVMEWGILETPILLTNTMSVGKVHSGVVTYMTKKYPQLGTKTDVIIPVVGETDDSFLNDVRVGLCGTNHVHKAIEAAQSGPVEQGSVGAGTGMITCDFAGGIGTSSRVLMHEEGGYTLGVLVLSNFGHMRNLTVDGNVVGRALDKRFEEHIRRTSSYGSIIVVIGTDAPLLSNQLNRIAKRAALGLGRVGSHAGSTSGEIIIAFSTANRLPRHQPEAKKHNNLKFISDQYINGLYECAIEATEEAVLNAIFCSNGMTGRENRFAPGIPHELVIEQLNQGRDISLSRLKETTCWSLNRLRQSTNPIGSSR
ncbi:MAG: P1 family peptidase [Bdellovibrionota bacterium]